MADINKETFSDETFDILCSMCKFQGKIKDGVKFCVNCHDYFCLSCAKLHTKVPVCIGHKVVDRDDSRRSLWTLTERCEEHSSSHSCKYIDMYCQNHDVGCSQCMADDHSVCDDTIYIPEFLRNNDIKMSTKEIRKRLDAMTKILTEQNDKCKLEKERLLKRKAKIIDNIERFRNEINDQLDKLQQNSVNKIEKEYRILEHKFEEELEQLKVIKARVTSACDKLAGKDNQVEVFINSKIGEYAATKADKYIHANQENFKIVDHVDFKIDRKILSQLKEAAALSMITVRKPTTTLKISSATVAKEVRQAPKVDVQKRWHLLHIKNSDSYRIKTGYDSEYTTCNITGACFMDNGTVILADGNHSSVKILDRHKFKVKDHFCLNDDPWQVCSVGMQEVAVTVPTRKKVSVLSLDKQTRYKIKTKFECRGIAFANDNLYISDTTSIHIYNLSEKEMKQFCVGEEEKELFSVIYSLAVNKNASRIYVADHENGLIVLDNNGKVVGHYNGLKLQGAHHCSVTREGSVLVSGGISNNILQFTRDGDLVGEIVKYRSTDMIHAVCCNQQMTKMCTTTRFSEDICVNDI